MPVARFQPDDQLPPAAVNCWWNENRVKSIFHAMESLILISTPGPTRVPKELCPNDKESVR